MTNAQVPGAKLTVPVYTRRKLVTYLFHYLCVLTSIKRRRKGRALCRLAQGTHFCSVLRIWHHTQPQTCSASRCADPVARNKSYLAILFACFLVAAACEVLSCSRRQAPRRPRSDVLSRRRATRGGLESICAIPVTSPIPKSENLLPYGHQFPHHVGRHRTLQLTPPDYGKLLCRGLR